MTLCDAGPLVALIDTSENSHARCVAALRQLPPEPLLTTWPCFTEAMYLLAQSGGYTAQEALWRMLATDGLGIHLLTPEEAGRMRNLMRQYRNVPMDLADASLVVVAETLHQTRIFTLDNDFHIYRIFGRDAFEVIP
ncbi:MAG: PIN domain-containing protein [Armatimonadetes bacterium]|nr:PIN domain-containing protein [Armatimonadota bacterium]